MKSLRGTPWPELCVESGKLYRTLHVRPQARTTFSLSHGNFEHDLQDSNACSQMTTLAQSLFQPVVVTVIGTLSDIPP